MEIVNTDDAPFELLAAFDRILYPPRGQQGGADGAPGYVGLGSGQVLRGKGLQVIPPGETLVVLTPGGAGLGDPAARDPERVAADRSNGMVTVPRAAE
jgi:N-methylhydantoinase B